MIDQGKIATCKHCKQNVTHHNKISSIETHLKKCKTFVKLMNQMQVCDRPEWYQTKRSKSSITQSSASSSHASQQCNIKTYAVPDLTKGQQAKLEECMAMHYYLTGSSFQRIEEPHLLEAFQICHPNVRMPSRKKLGSTLLDQCFNKVKKEVNKILLASNTYVSVTTDA